ncbi:MAG: hypothetical protein PF487_06275 [Bacteroidales bacterium]|jgi:hypothetical protein|nr:hypothetical protein [Bacteroidales bacterium]
MDYYQAGESIECLSAEIISKRFNNGILKKHPKNGKTYMYYKTDRSGTAEILEEIECDEPLLDENAHTDKGDKLNGDKLEIYVDSKRRLKPVHIGGHTAKHGARKFITKVFTFAKIIKRYETIPFIDNSKKELDTNK